MESEGKQDTGAGEPQEAVAARDGEETKPCPASEVNGDSEAKDAAEDGAKMEVEKEAADEAAEGAKAAEDAAKEDEGAKAEDAAMEEEKAEEAEAEDEGKEPEEPEVPKEPEEPKEPEGDAPEDSRARIDRTVEVSAMDSTMNVLPSCGGKVLLGLTDGGFQYLVAAARATVGVKAGRYFYEVRIVENRNPLDHSAKMHNQKTPRQCCALGFTPAGSSLFLGSEAEGVGFDSEGNFVSGEVKRRVGAQWGCYSEVFGVLLNLDSGSPCANTVSLFCNGVRVCKPQPIPPSLVGKALFPTFNYKSMTLHVNFGPATFAPLPFKCLTFQDAAVEDAVLTEPPAPDAPREVLFPVGLPDEGTFDWLDGFLKEHPGYTELSARAALEWGLKSGLRRQGGLSRTCNDRPSMDFGIRDLDEGIIHKMIQCMTPVLKRSYVVMEVRQNLLANERRQLLSHFDGEDFRKVALVVMGEPPEQHKAAMRELALEDKRRRQSRESLTRRRPPPPPPAARRPGAEDQNANEENGKPQDGDKKEEKDENGAAEAEPAVELTEQEQKLWFRKPVVEDLVSKELASCFADFTLPTEDEGFDEIRFVWQPKAACAEYLQNWIGEHKLTQRVEDLQAGAWFREQWAEWQRQLQDWRRRHAEWGPSRKRKVEKRKQEEPAEKPSKDSEASKEEEPGKEAEPDKEGEEGTAEQPEKQEEEKEAKKEDQDANMEVSSEEPGVFAVEDVCDIGDGEPLFANFSWEDWMLLSLRFELHLMVHAYKYDVNDPERISFHLSHLSFYYDRYFKKPLNLKYFGATSSLELLELVKDTMEVTPKTSLLDPQLSEDTPLDNFLRLTEDHRRERQWRLDAGDETVALKFQRPPPRGGDKGGKSGKGAGAYQQRDDNRGGYQSRTPPPAPYGRPGAYGSRMGAPSSGPQPSRYGGSGGGSYGGSRGPPPGGRRDDLAPPHRSRPSAPLPPSRSHHGPPPYGSSGGSGHKRPYEPPPSGGYSQYKQPRTSSHAHAGGYRR